MKEITQEEIDNMARWLVEDNIIMNASWFMDDLVHYAYDCPQGSALDIDEYESKCYGIICPECGSINVITKEEYDEDYYSDEDDENSENEKDFSYYCKDCEEKFNEENHIEVLEYWFVQDFLANKLEEKGEAVLREPATAIWCRQTSGQAIYLDSVLQEIAKEILEYRNR